MKKKSEVIIETPEKIRFSYQIAEVGTRIAAYVIDQMIQTLIILAIIWLVFGSVSAGFAKSTTHLSAAFFFIILFLLRWFYFVLFEIIMEGQSPGKRMMRIRVLRDNGDSLDWETIIFRNFLRAVDDFPIVPLLGGFVALIDPQNRRLGDLVANTIVVKEINHDLILPDFQVYFHKLNPRQERIEAKYKLSEHELYIIRRFLNERYKLPAEKEEEMAKDLADQVRKKMGIEEEPEDAFLFLERVYYQHET